MNKIINHISTFVLIISTIIISTACSDEEKKDSRYPAPTITGFTPIEGLPGSVVTITGTNFGSERLEKIGRVYFGDAEVTDYIEWSDTQVRVRVPEDGQTGQITMWVWKESVETTSVFTCIPGAEITAIDPSVVFPGATIVLHGKNFGYFIEKGLAIDDIIVDFVAEEGTTPGTVTEFTENTLSVIVPADAKRGNIIITFGEYQQITGPEVVLVGDMIFTLSDYIEIYGDIDLEDAGFGNTKDGAYVIYEFIAPATGLFDAYTMSTTARDGSYLNVNISDDFNTIKTQGLNDLLTKEIVNTGGWDPSYDRKATYGPFYLQENKTYYLKVTFLQDGTTWVGNLHELGLTLSDDQTQIPVNPGGTGSQDYVIYQNDFNGTSYYPFYDGWAWDPSYIKIVDQCLEFYFNQQAYYDDPRRMRAGCEVTCNYKTTTEGWYGFKIYLPEGKFGHDLGESIIAQIFNNGDRNSWAGHVSIHDEELVISHRYALIDPTVGKIGKLTWNTWIPVVVHFKVGRNNKGRIRAWMGDNMKESEPAYEANGINFGFGEWIDDETLNGEVTDDNEVADYIGCKFGLYVYHGGDRTIRFDDLKALEGNPSGAFTIVKP